MTERTRTVVWEDPIAGAAVVRSMSGLAYLRGMLAGELPVPPISALMGLEIAEVEEGRVVFTVMPAEYHYNPVGVVHGGLGATLCDTATACAILSMLPPGVGCTTLELKVNFVRALTKDTGLVRCEGKTIHVGGRIATAEARVVDEAGALYAHATCTCMILR